jgi:hypothetical protein
MNAKEELAQMLGAVAMQAYDMGVKDTQQASLAAIDCAYNAGAAAEREKNPAQWQSIETAPKDGSLIDLLVDGMRVADCRWFFSKNERGEPLVRPAWDGWIRDKVWVGQYPSGVGGTPTHWMPIPAAPTAIQAIDITAASTSPQTPEASPGAPP